MIPNRRLTCLLPLFFLLLQVNGVFAHDPPLRRGLSFPEYTFGLEQDVLPYVLRGFIGTGWIGRDGMRVRFSYAQATQPRFFLGEGIRRDRVEAFGLSMEYFLNGRFERWWLGPGIGFWTDVVDTDGGVRHLHESTIFTMGGGYVLPITRWLYASSWTAVHARVSGNRPVDLVGATYRPAVLTPEVSVKVGIMLRYQKDNLNQI